MCDPTGGIATAAVIAATIGTAVYSADVQKKGAEAVAQGQEQQARIAEMGKADAMAQGDRETERLLWRTRGLLGEQRAAFGSAGVDPTLGTPSELLGETALFGEIEQQDARLNAARAAWGYDVDAINSRNDAANSRWQGKAQANTTILGGLASAATMGAGAWGKSTANQSIGPVTRQRIAIPQSSYRFR